jgi:hypothetical protein
MHDAIQYVGLFHAVAALELFAVAAIQACRPAQRRNPRVMWIAEPMPAARVAPDASNQDFAESYDEAA